MNAKGVDINVSSLLTEPGILVTVSKYLQTTDVIKISSINRSFRETIIAEWIHFTKGIDSKPEFSILTNMPITGSFFHCETSSFESCESTLRYLVSCGVIVDNIQIPSVSTRKFDTVFEELMRIREISSLSNDIHVCQLVFAQGNPSRSCDESDIEYSNFVSVPGGTIRLFRRAVSSLYPGNAANGTAYVLGIDLNTPKIWLCRVKSLFDFRLDLKAGMTRSDILRVPNGSKGGTWTDLFPISRHSPILNPDNIFMIEYITNSSSN